MDIFRRLLLVIIALSLSLVFVSKASADVYGYQLSIYESLTGSRAVTNGASVSKTDILANGLQLNLEITPTLEITDDIDWQVTISSKTNNGKVISSGSGFWNAQTTLVNNKKKCLLSLTTGENLNGYSVVFSSVVKRDNKDITNPVNFTISITDFTSTSNVNSNQSVAPVAISTTPTPISEPVSTSELTPVESVARDASTAVNVISSKIKTAITANLKIPAEQTQVTLSLTSVGLTALSSLRYSVGLLGVMRKKRRWGRVIDKNKVAISSVKISLFKETGSGWQKVSEALSDKEGDFDFPIQPEGNYKISLEKDGFTVIWDQVFEPSTVFHLGPEGRNSVFITIEMNANPDTKPSRRSINKSPFLILLALVFPVIGTVILIGETTTSQYLSLFVSLYIVSWFLCVFALRKSRQTYIQ